MIEFCIFDISFQFTDNAVYFSVPVTSPFIESRYQLFGVAFQIGLLIQNC